MLKVEWIKELDLSWVWRANALFYCFARGGRSWRSIDHILILLCERSIGATLKRDVQSHSTEHWRLEPIEKRV
jgi:hypothetical protein